MRAQWKGALTRSGTTFAVYFCSISATARSTAVAWPEMTICFGELMLAASQTSPCAASAQTSATVGSSRPIIAAIEPTPSGTALCMRPPRLWTSLTPSLTERAPEATSAVYSPRLWPAMQTGSTAVPSSCSSARNIATLTVSIAGCVISVWASCSGVPLNIMSLSEKPSASSASSKILFAAIYLSQTSFPIPGRCAPCPGNIIAYFI